MEVTVTYHKHSGFSFRTESHLLVFDYIGGSLPEPVPGDNAIVFISHAHGDHCSPIAIDWHKRGLAELAAGYDVSRKAGGLRMKPGDETDIAGSRVEAFGSTDSGVSFLVNAGGTSVYHAGDFNLWHWREQSNDSEIAEATRSFTAILDTLRGKHVDVAFFPVDPRLGKGHDEGAILFAEAVRPRYIIPMHWWGDAAVALAFSKKQMPQGVTALALTEPGLPVEIII